MSLSESNLTQYVTDDDGFADGQSEVYVVPSSPHNSWNTVSSGHQGQVVDETVLWHQLPHVAEGEVDNPVEVVEQGVEDGFATLDSLARCARCGLRQVDLLSMCRMCKDRLCQTCSFSCHRVRFVPDADVPIPYSFCEFVYCKGCLPKHVCVQRRTEPDEQGDSPEYSAPWHPCVPKRVWDFAHEEYTQEFRRQEMYCRIRRVLAVRALRDRESQQVCNVSLQVQKAPEAIGLAKAGSCVSGSGGAEQNGLILGPDVVVEQVGGTGMHTQVEPALPSRIECNSARPISSPKGKWRFSPVSRMC